MPSYRLVFAAAAATCLYAFAPADAQTPAGVLECDVSAGTGSVVGSTKALSCLFHPISGPVERYDGTLSTLGVDVGFTGTGHLSWGVAMADLTQSRFPLAGSYSGATAGLTVGAGAKANTLVGGNGNSVSLQPVSISTQTGLDISAGIGSMILTPVLPPPAPNHR